jgi:hypothetical protein
MKSPKVNILKSKLIAALEKSLGIVTTACKNVGCDRTTFYNYYNSDEEFKNKVDAIQELTIDFAESQLFKSIQNGSDTATIFYLKCKGKKRGYIDRAEMDVTTNGKDINNITFTVANNQTIDEVKKLLNETNK